MRKLAIMLAMMLWTFASMAQLSGTYTVGTGGDYATIAAAVTALNTQGIGAGGATFNVAAGHTETAPVGGIVLGSTTLNATLSAANPLVFQKSGAGVNPLITAFVGTTTTTDGIFKLQGTDYVTITRIDLQESAANTTTTTQMEWGYALVKLNGAAPFDGCQNIQINGCSINLSTTNSNTYGIYLGNHIATSTTSLTITATTDANSFNKFYSNTITAYSGFRLAGFSAVSPYTLFDQNNEVGESGGNTITCGGGSSTSYGTYSIYQNNLKINNNTITTGSLQTSTTYGIMLSSGINANIDANNNEITLSPNGTTNAVNGIYVSQGTTTGTTNVVNLKGNTITINRTTATTGSTYFIYSTSNYPQILNIEDNDLGSAGSSLSGTGSVYGLYQISSVVNINIKNNNVRNITRTGTTSTSAFYGLYNTASTTTCEFSGNNVYNLTNNGSSGILAGIVSNATGTKIFNNQIYNLTSLTSSGLAYGLYITGGTTAYAYNNFISDIKAPASTNLIAVNGIYVSGGTTIGLFYNSIYLNASSSGATFGSSGIYASTTPTIEIRNNIVVNNSTPAGTGLTVAYRRSTTTLTTYSNNSNNNDWYAGTPGASNLIYYDGTNADQTILAFKTRVAPRDASSFTEMPPFNNVATAPYDLHLRTTVPTQCEAGGSPVTSPSITTDIDGNTRNATTPDVGADEGTFIVLDLTGPQIAYTPLLNTPNTTARTLVATITDVSGVPSSGTGQPQLYWAINGGSYTGVTATSVAGNDFTFTFGAGVSTGDIITYFVAAQDNNANVSVFPNNGAGGLTANPPAAGTPPTNPSSYTITGAPLCGDYTVGAAGDYPTITAALADLNTKGLSCSVRFLLLDATYTTETLPLTVFIQNVNTTTVGKTVTIKPNTGVTSAISGASATSMVFLIKDSNVFIDGSNSAGGTSRDLTITNTSTTSPQVVRIGSTGTTPITNVTLKNCILINGANTSTAVTVYAADGTAGYFNNITIQNNSIQKAYMGIYNLAVAATGNGSGLLITQNDMNSTGTDAIRLVGVYVQGVDGATISYNNIGNMNNTVDASNYSGIWFATGTVNSTISGNIINGMTSTTAAPRGIAVSSGISPSNVNITGNTINNLTTSYSSQPYGIYVFGTTTGVNVNENKVSTLLNSNTGGYGARGIYIATGLAASSINVLNNFVWDIKCTGDVAQTYWNIGIGMDGITGGVNIQFNSVNLYGTYAGYNSATNSAALYLGTGTGFDIRNNILVNSFDNTTVTTDKAYAIYTAGTNAGFTTINYNDYYVSGTPGVLGFLTADVTTLGDWQTATTQDANSVNGDPFFESNANLHIQTAAVSPVSNAGTAIAGVTTDIDGDTRNNPPDIGADEYTYSPPTVDDPTGVSATAMSSSQIDVAFTPNLDNDNVLIVWNLTGTFTAPSGMPPAIGQSFAGGTVLYYGTTSPVSHSGLLSNTPYHYRAYSYDGTNYSPGVYVSATPPAVANPSPFTAIAVSGTQIDLSWTKNAADNNVMVAVNSTNTFGTPVAGATYIANDPITGGGTVIYNGPASGFNHTGLTASTPYYYKAWSHDAAINYSTGATANATTPCNAITTLPWTEGFEGVTTPALPSCWYKENGDWITTTNSASTYDADARTGTQFLRESWSATNEYVWTPGFELTAGSSYDFKFWWAGDTYDEWTGDVFVNSVQNSTGATQIGASFVTPSTTTTKTYAQFSYTFVPSTTQIYYFAIRVNATSNPWYLSFDDFSLENTPSCQAPSALNASGVTSNSAQIGWTENGTATTWQIEYGTGGFTPGMGTTLSGIVTNPYTLTGLSANQSYDVYVRSDCGSGSYSTWAGPVSFITTQNPASLPFAEGFETGLGDWSVINGTQVNKWYAGTAVAYNGTQSAYISDDGGVSNNYNVNSTSVVHIYRDITFPAGADGFALSFWWKGVGETTLWDYLRVSLIETSQIPVAGTLLASGQIGDNYYNQATYQNPTILIPNTHAGTTKRLVFTWRNDGSLGTQPPVSLDDILLQTATYATITTDATTAIAATTATSGGNVTSSGNLPVTARGVCWNTTGTPTIADPKTTDGTGTGPFVSSVTGLTAGETYHVRAYATNALGTSYGNEEVFTTLNNVTFNVDVSTISGFVHGTDLIYIAGNFPGASWNEPGTNPNLLLSRVGVTDIYTITLQLPDYACEYKYFRNATWSFGEWTGGPNRALTVSGNTTTEDVFGGIIDWANLQWPANGAITEGGTFNVYGQAYIPNGITFAPGATYGLEAWVGISSTDSDPSGWTTWVPALFNTQAGDNDEFTAEIAGGLTPGTYYYAFRYRFGQTYGEYLYGGFSSGFWNGTTNVSGVLTVNPAVVDKFLDVTVYLEGPFNGTDMNTDLNTNGDVPLNQPFNVAPWLYAGTESVAAIPADVVDWVLVDLRDADDPGNALPATSLAGWPKAFFLKNDGQIVGLDGTSLPNIGNPTLTDDMYVIVRHMNHIDVMSATGATLTGNNYTYDFSTALTQAYNAGAGYKSIGGGLFGMVSGDADADGTVLSSDFNSWAGQFGNEGYLGADMDLDGQVLSSDFNKWAGNFGTDNPIEGGQTGTSVYSSQVPDKN